MEYNLLRKKRGQPKRPPATPAKEEEPDQPMRLSTLLERIGKDLGFDKKDDKEDVKARGGGQSQSSWMDMPSKMWDGMTMFCKHVEKMIPKW